MNLLWLSKDCLFEVSGHLTFLGLIQLSQTCKYFRHLIHSPLVWKQFFQNRSIPLQLNYNYDDYIKYWRSWTLSCVMEQTLLKNSFIYFKYIPNTGLYWNQNSLYHCNFNVSNVDAFNRQLMIYPSWINQKHQAKTLLEYELWLRDVIEILIIDDPDDFDDPLPVPQEFKVILSFEDPPCPSYSHPHFMLNSIDIDIFWDIINTSNTIEKTMHNIEEKILSDHSREFCKSDENHGRIPTTEDIFEYAYCAKANFRTEWKNLKTHICTLFRTILNT